MSHEISKTVIKGAEGVAAQPHGQLLVCQPDDVRLEHETIWLTQQHMAELFQATIPNISMHLRNIFADGELQLPETVKEFLTVRQEENRQVSRSVGFYNLDAIISVGYIHHSNP